MANVHKNDVCDFIDKVRDFMKSNSSNLLLLSKKFHINIDKNRICDYELLEVDLNELKVSIRDNKNNVTYNSYVSANHKIKNNDSFIKASNSHVENLVYNFSNATIPYVVFSVECEMDDFNIIKEYTPCELYGEDNYRWLLGQKKYDSRRLLVQITSANEKKIEVGMFTPYPVPILCFEYSSNPQSIINEAREDSENFYFHSHYNGNIVDIRGGNTRSFYHPFYFSFTNNCYYDKNDLSNNFEFSFPKYEFSWISLERKYFVNKTNDNNIRRIEFIEQVGENKFTLFTLNPIDDSDYLTKDEIKCIIEKLSNTYMDKTLMNFCIGALKVSAESINNGNDINKCPIWDANSLFSYLNYVGKTDDEIFDFIVKNIEIFFDRKIKVSPIVNELLGTPEWESYHETERKSYMRKLKLASKIHFD